MKRRFSEESRSDHIALLRAFEVRVHVYTCIYMGNAPSKNGIAQPLILLPLYYML